MTIKEEIYILANVYNSVIYRTYQKVQAWLPNKLTYCSNGETHVFHHVNMCPVNDVDPENYDYKYNPWAIAFMREILLAFDPGMMQIEGNYNNSNVIKTTHLKYCKEFKTFYDDTRSRSLYSEGCA